MTATELQAIVRRLANQSWCRYWLLYCNRGSGIWMAIQCRDSDGSPEEIPELISLGFREDNLAASDCLYIIRRKNDDGSWFETDVI